MRVTNQMITNTSMYNINRNKNSLSTLEQQYSSGKKIQRPSEDPIVAVRALKLRTNLSELNQYYEKNIPDAKSWMDVTESALTNINEILTKVNTSFNQGANDTLTSADRTSIMENLLEYKKQIYQEGNSNYAGRYVFTGYKTDKSLVFNEASENVTYTIDESFTGKDIQATSTVINEYKISDYTPSSSTSADFTKAPTIANAYRLRLSYDTLDSTVPIKTINYTAADGTPQTFNVSNNGDSISKDALNAYNPGPDEINYIAETGELVFGKNVYDELRLSTDIGVTYGKKSFSEGDLRPEHYFDCKAVDQYNKEYVYTQSDQQIQYEINFNQKLTVNTQGKDTIVHGIARDIDEVAKAISDVENTEFKLSETKKMLEDSNITDTDKEALNQMVSQFETELVLKNKLLQDKFEQGIAGSSAYQDDINTAVSDLGSRYVRLELTEDRLSTQQVDFEDLLSTNEDADIVETYIKLSSKEVIYNASLQAASKIVKSTLLDFI